MFQKKKLGLLVMVALAASACAAPEANDDPNPNPSPSAANASNDPSVPNGDDDEDDSTEADDPTLGLPADSSDDEKSEIGDLQNLDPKDDGEESIDPSDATHAGPFTDFDVAKLDEAQKASGRANTDTYTRTGWRYVGDLQACLKYTVTGKVTYRAERLPMIGGQVAWRLTNITFVAPKTTTTMYHYDPGNHACTTREFKVRKLSVSNAFSGYGCTWNPQIQVGGPVPSVAVGFWPSCGDKRAARYTGTVESRATMIQANQDTRIKYANQVVLTQGSKPSNKSFKCYGAAIKGKITAGGTVATVKSPRRKICLSPSF